MSDSPSPLALAREAEKKAFNSYLVVRSQEWLKWNAGPSDTVGSQCIDEALEALHAAQRAHREALVEATLRWAAKPKGWHYMAGKVYDEQGEPRTFADVLTAIEKEGR